jgi:hypothetical protein
MDNSGPEECRRGTLTNWTRGPLAKFSRTLVQENTSGVKAGLCFLYLKSYLNFGTLAQVKHKFILRSDQQRHHYFNIVTTRTERKITGEAVTLFPKR